MTKLLWVGENGSEEVLEDGQWKKLRPGHYLAQMLGPFLKNVRGGALTQEQLPDIRLYMALFGSYVALIPASQLKEWSQRETARTIFADLEGQGIFPVGNVKFGPLSQLTGIWGGMQSQPMVRKVRKEVFGWSFLFEDLKQAAVGELFFLITFNIRKLKLCPQCVSFHWEKGHAICRSCRSAKDRARDRSGRIRVPTDRSRFLNKLAQAHKRNTLTPRQQDYLRGVLKREGVESAERGYKRIMGDTSRKKRL